MLTTTELVSFAFECCATRGPVPDAIRLDAELLLADGTAASTLELCLTRGHLLPSAAECNVADAAWSASLAVIAAATGSNTIPTNVRAS